MRGAPAASPVTRRFLSVSAAAAARGSAATTAQRGTAVTTNEVVPLQFTVLIPCVPEDVSVDGLLHIVNHTTVNPDGSFHVVSHFNPQGVSGIGNSTGHTYRELCDARRAGILEAAMTSKGLVLTRDALDAYRRAKGERRRGKKRETALVTDLTEHRIAALERAGVKVR